MLFPSTANLIADNVGASNSYGFDLSAACSGFLYALTTGSQFIESGTHKKVVVIGADKMSSIIDYDERKNCVLFGDGGGAVLLERSNDETGIQDYILKSDGSGRDMLCLKAGGSLRPASTETLKNKEHYIYQEGSSVFKFAVTNMADISEEIMKKNNLSSNEVSSIVVSSTLSLVSSSSLISSSNSSDNLADNIDCNLGVNASSRAALAFARATSRTALASAIASFKMSFAIFLLVFSLSSLVNKLYGK